MYESLLELHPDINAAAATFALTTAAGHERKTTGSYYTPTSLVECLLDSALDPVLAEAARQPEPEKAILQLKVCDPACGSGHFLIAAAHRIANRLVAIRTGDEEPSPEAVRKAMRDVIGHCIYGVDMNPMAVELCKVTLWIEALEPGKPLSFLEHRIQCGNSLLGATPALLRDGIPDEAFEPIEGDDKDYCRKFKKENKKERAGQLRLLEHKWEPWQRLGSLATAIVELDAISDDTVQAQHAKQERWEQLVRSSGYEFGRLLADAWCAAFVWKKAPDPKLQYPITEDTYRRIEKNPHWAPDWMKAEIRRLAAEYQFFHWHLAFPAVFRIPATGEEAPKDGPAWLGGFDVVLGNPPWEKLQIEEKHFFAAIDPEIATASAKTRKQLIAKLSTTSPDLFKRYREALRLVEAQTHVLRFGGAYPFSGQGNVSTHSLFLELAISLGGSASRVGLVVPTGLATQDSQKELFTYLVSSKRLAILFDFENRLGLFPSVDSRFRFAVVVVAGPEKPQAARFAFFLQLPSDIKESGRAFSMSIDDLRRVSPNTLSCPTLSNGREARLLKEILLALDRPVTGEPTGEPLGLAILADVQRDA